jgi:hypothetical protein
MSAADIWHKNTSYCQRKTNNSDGGTWLTFDPAYRSSESAKWIVEIGATGTELKIADCVGLDACPYLGQYRYRVHFGSYGAVLPASGWASRALLLLASLQKCSIRRVWQSVLGDTGLCRIRMLSSWKAGTPFLRESNRIHKLRALKSDTAVIIAKRDAGIQFQGLRMSRVWWPHRNNRDN